MKTLKTVGIVLALLFTVVAAAEAIDLYTAPLYVVDADLFYCSIVNVSTADKTVRIRIIDPIATVLEDSGDVVLGPGDGYSVHTGLAEGSAYCRFTVSGSKTQVRASAKIRPSSITTETVTLAAE